MPRTSAPPPVHRMNPALSTNPKSESSTPMTTTIPVPVPVPDDLDLDVSVDVDVDAPPSITSTEPRSNRVTFGRLVSAEWLKFRTVRSNMIALLGAAAAAVGFGVLFSSLSGSEDGPGSFATDGLSLSLGGFDLSLLIVAILGVSMVAAEYQSGMIRSWFAAAPYRSRVLLAKVGVYSTTVFVVTGVAAVVAFLAGQAVLPDTATTLTLADDGVLQALAGTAFYAATIGAMGVGLGFLLRSTGAGAGAVVSMLMVAPLLVSLLPSSLADPIGKILPSNAASAVTGTTGRATELLSTGWGLVVLGGWVVAIVGAAAISLHRRDA